MIQRRISKQIEIGNVKIGGDAPISVQSMTNTDTRDVKSTLKQINNMVEHGCELVRLAILNSDAADSIRQIKKLSPIPIIADIHFDYRLAIKCIENGVDALRLNPGNIGKEENIKKVVSLAKINNIPIRIGINGGSLEKDLEQSSRPLSEKMVESALRHIKILEDNNFDKIKVSLKSSDVLTTIEAYKIISQKINYPLHLGVTEAGNGDGGRIKSAVGISALLSEGIGNTIRVSLTEDPANELPVARYLSDRYGRRLHSSMVSLKLNGKKAVAEYAAPSRERLLLDFSCDFGKRLLDKELDEVELTGTYLENGEEISLEGSGYAAYLVDELMQAARRRFYRPEYIACPGCGRTMYNLESTFEEVKRRTAHLKGMVIAVMGCIVNGPGEMADADWGYVGEGNGKVSIYKGKEPLERHVPENEAIDKLLKYIEQD